MNAEKNTRATRATLDKKTSDIAAMFDTVAERYDLMNGILSLGQHIYWRKQAVAAVDAHPGQKVLDVAAGTGVSSEPFADAGVDVIAADLSEGMLDVGRRRRPDMTFVQADVTALPFDDETFDAVTMSYGLRNVANYPKALSEIYRVLKPGGRIVILEFSTRNLLQPRILRIPCRVHHHLAQPAGTGAEVQGGGLHLRTVPQPHRRHRRHSPRFQA